MGVGLKTHYPEWSDKYSVQILVAIGNGSWKEYFKLNEGHNEKGFYAQLTYPDNGHTYEGQGSSKRDALHKASFSLIKAEEIKPEMIKEKVLDILELANGFGAGIDSKKFKDIKDGTMFVSIYEDARGTPASDK